MSNKQGDGKLTRQALHKIRSPAWKETYRKRCLERLKENRSKCHALRRDLYESAGRGHCADGTDPAATVLTIDEIMEQEWKQISREYQPGACVNETGEEGAQYIDSMVSLYEEVCSELKKEIHSDLQREEEQLLRLQEMCEAEEQHEEDELCSALESLTTEEVICPLCEKSSLIEHKGIILCCCGLRIDTEQDCISLKNIKSNLKAGASEHSNQCEAKPEFSFCQKFGITNILMSCPECDFLFIIL